VQAHGTAPPIRAPAHSRLTLTCSRGGRPVHVFGDIHLGGLVCHAYTGPRHMQLTTQVDAPMREFLIWVARCPRTYSDAMEAWGSHCPRFTVWEDALAEGLVHVELAAITLTPRGQGALSPTSAAWSSARAAS